jgi:hypothetical protein
MGVTLHFATLSGVRKSGPLFFKNITAYRNCINNVQERLWNKNDTYFLNSLLKFTFERISHILRLAEQLQIYTTYLILQMWQSKSLIHRMCAGVNNTITDSLRPTFTIGRIYYQMMSKWCLLCSILLTKCLPNITFLFWGQSNPERSKEAKSWGAFSNVICFVCVKIERTLRCITS